MVGVCRLDVHTIAMHSGCDWVGHVLPSWKLGLECYRHAGQVVGWGRWEDPRQQHCSINTTPVRLGRSRDIRMTSNHSIPLVGTASRVISSLGVVIHRAGENPEA